MEEWREIKGYEGLYEVSNTGKVRSLKRATTRGKILRFQTDKDGYFKCCLCKENKKTTAFVHRLVAIAFIDNPKNYPIINHKDECKNNNNVENLEWCSYQYNATYNGVHLKNGVKKRIPIRAIKGNEILEFVSIKEASEYLGVAHYNISGCLHNHRGRKTLSGYRFEYL